MRPEQGNVWNQSPLLSTRLLSLPKISSELSLLFCSIPLLFHLLSLFFFLLHPQNEQFVWITGSQSRLTYSDWFCQHNSYSPVPHRSLFDLQCDYIEKKKKKCPSLTGAALARNPAKCSFQPSSDCLIGIHCCVCQECWQNLALICIKQEGAEISLLFCVPLPLLHPKEKSACNSQKKKKKH